MRECCPYREAKFQGRLWTVSSLTPVIDYNFDRIESLTINASNKITNAKNMAMNGFDLDSGGITWDTVERAGACDVSNPYIYSSTSKSLGSTTSFTVLSILKPTSSSQATINTPLDWDHSSGGGYGPFVAQSESSDNSHYYSWSNGTNFYFANVPKMPAPALNTWAIMVANMTSGTLNNYFNGSLVSGFPRTGGGAVSTHARRFCIGTALGYTGRLWRGKVKRVVIVPGFMSLRHVKLIEGEAAWQAGLQSLLVASHPFRNRPPMIGD